MGDGNELDGRLAGFAALLWGGGGPWRTFRGACHETNVNVK